VIGLHSKIGVTGTHHIMKHILILGAGRSAAALIHFLSQQDVQVQIVDVDQQIIKRYESRYENVTATSLDIFDDSARINLISSADLVISMLPARFHIHVARTCVEVGKNLLTASYVDKEVEKLKDQIEEKGLLFLYECGLDPGIDHMSAMRIIDDVKERGGTVTSFISNTGGLMAPGSDDNPWRYKITWNPRNVVLAGKGGAAIYMLHGIYKHIPHHQLFKRLSEIEIPGFGKFESYPNRDSLKYINLYKLKNVETVLRGTLRRPGFCSAWNAFVQLGMTDDSYKVYQVKEMTYNDFTRTYLPYSKLDPKINFANYLHLSPDSSEMEKIEWLGILKHELIGLEEATPAQVMQKLLEEKWKAQPDDEDLIVMQHKLEYEMDGEKHKVISSMAHTGSFETLTGMAQCVGYPLGIAAMGILNGEIEMKGLHIPVEKQIYEPVLEKLKSLGIDFIEEDEVIPVVDE